MVVPADANGAGTGMHEGFALIHPLLHFLACNCLPWYALPSSKTRKFSTWFQDPCDGLMSSGINAAKHCVILASPAPGTRRLSAAARMQSPFASLTLSL